VHSDDGDAAALRVVEAGILACSRDHRGAQRHASLAGQKARGPET